MLTTRIPKLCCCVYVPPLPLYLHELNLGHQANGHFLEESISGALFFQLELPAIIWHTSSVYYLPQVLLLVDSYLSINDRRRVVRSYSTGCCLRRKTVENKGFNEPQYQITKENKRSLKINLNSFWSPLHMQSYPEPSRESSQIWGRCEQLFSNWTQEFGTCDHSFFLIYVFLITTSHLIFFFLIQPLNFDNNSVFAKSNCYISKWFI